MSFLYRAGRALPKSSLRPLVSSVRQSFQPSTSTFLRANLKYTSRPVYSAFSTSCFRREPAGESDLELSAKLDSEQRLETQARDPAALPENLQEFITKSAFDLSDSPGTENIVLTREFGNETIKVEFSIADLNTPYDESAQLEEDTAFDDEDPQDIEVAPQGKRTINQSGKDADVMPEDSIAPSDREEDVSAGQDSLGPAYPVQLHITITKPNTGAIQIAASASDGIVSIEQVHYFPNPELADPLSHENERRQELVYAGPPFENLDQELQSLLEQYIAERGINEQLALFAVEYVDYKEQREYVQWLDNMKSFIET